VFVDKLYIGTTTLTSMVLLFCFINEEAETDMPGVPATQEAGIRKIQFQRQKVGETPASQ
jgi:hypothetical protein